MAEIFIQIDDWAKGIAENEVDSVEYNKLMGLSPNGAGAELNVSRQMIHRLVGQGKLDEVICLDSQSRKVATLISIESIRNYKNNRASYAQVRKMQEKLDFDTN